MWEKILTHLLTNEETPQINKETVKRNARDHKINNDWQRIYTMYKKKRLCTNTN